MNTESDPAAIARELQLDACLAEALGATVADDLAARIATRLRACRVPAPRTAWLAAALVLLGTGIVGAVLLLRDREDPSRREAAPPQPSPAPPPSQQDPQEPRLDTTTTALADRLLAALDLPAERRKAVQELAALGPAIVPRIDQAIAIERPRGRAEVLTAMELARSRTALGVTARAFDLPPLPVILIADYSDNLVTVVDDQGGRLLRFDDMYGAWDAELTSTGTMLVTEFSVSRVEELDPRGNQVWFYDSLKNPCDADRLPNGNTLIADTFGSRVIEVNPQKQIVWKYDTEIRPFDCDRLANGNTLIADVLKDRVIEVSPAGEIVWQVLGMNNVHDADRLPNGNTLITLRSKGSVVEVDRADKIVWELTGLMSPSDADRLPDGNTLVAENTQVREFDPQKNVVWHKATTWAVEAQRY